MSFLVLLMIGEEGDPAFSEPQDPPQEGLAGRTLRPALLPISHPIHSGNYKKAVHSFIHI